MAQLWQAMVVKINALGLRERVILFVSLALLLIMGVNSLWLDRYFGRQLELEQQIRRDQAEISRTQAEIRQLQSASADPGQAQRQHLQELRQRAERIRSSLSDLQKALVSPARMTGVLADIIKREGGLRLLSLTTLPVTSLQQSTGSGHNRQSEGMQAAGPVYRHGVEIVVQGSYPDMVRYMEKLEAMPERLLWGKVELSVEEYPQSRLRLTLYTLSLDKEWLSF